MINIDKFDLGNAIRFEAEFHDWDNQLVDPPLIKLFILDENYKKIREIIVGPNNKISQGKYFAFHLGDVLGLFNFYWYTEIDGLPSTKYGQFIVER